MSPRSDIKWSAECFSGLYWDVDNPLMITLIDNIIRYFPLYVVNCRLKNQSRYMFYGHFKWIMNNTCVI